MSPFAPWTEQVSGAKFGEEQETDIRTQQQKVADVLRAANAGKLGGTLTVPKTIPNTNIPFNLSGIPQWMQSLTQQRGATYYPGMVTSGVSQAALQPAPEIESPAPVPTLPEPGSESGTLGQPIIVDVGGEKFWWDPSTYTWNRISPETKSGSLSFNEQQALAKMSQQAQMEYLQQQYQYEQQMAREAAQQQEAIQREAARQALLQMYAADPYKYWAQMGAMTPEAVARLTGGAVKTGEQFQQGTPLSTPSAQWWSNLVPSEQEQIAGGLNWLGVNPQDWFSMYQRMIPGLGSRQVEPQWAM
uniref:Uncharacterized protein n=1 Tax=viral metagenome TaxID=1070528 RepID=A0A6M3KND9_9ZZZZ